MVTALTDVTLTESDCSCGNSSA